MSLSKYTRVTINWCTVFVVYACMLRMQDTHIYMASPKAVLLHMHAVGCTILTIWSASTFMPSTRPFCYKKNSLRLSSSLHPISPSPTGWDLPSPSSSLSQLCRRRREMREERMRKRYGFVEYKNAGGLFGKNHGGREAVFGCWYMYHRSEFS